MLCIAEELSEKLNAVGIKAEYIAEDKDNYTDELVNFTHPKDNGDSLAVMKDFGVTWSPSCTTTTPRFCDVDVNDIDSAALELKMVATAWLVCRHHDSLMFKVMGDPLIDWCSAYESCSVDPSEDVQMAMVDEDWRTVGFINNPSKKVQLAAVRQDIRSIKLIRNLCKEVVNLELVNGVHVE